MVWEPGARQPGDMSPVFGCDSLVVMRGLSCEEGESSAGRCHSLEGFCTAGYTEIVSGGTWRPKRETWTPTPGQCLAPPARSKAVGPCSRRLRLEFSTGRGCKRRLRAEGREQKFWDSKEKKPAWSVLSRWLLWPWSASGPVPEELVTDLSDNGTWDLEPRDWGSDLLSVQGCRPRQVSKHRHSFLYAHKRSRECLA